MVRITLKRARAEIGDLPCVCAQCGARDARPSPVTLPFTPTALSGDARGEQVVAHVFPAVGFALGLGAIVHGLFTGKKMTLLLPLCEGHKQTAAWISSRLPMASLAFGSLAVALSVFWVFALFLMDAREVGFFQWDFHSLIASLALACACVALVLRAYCHDSFIYLLKVTDDELELGGLAEEFALELARIDDRR